MRPPSAAAGRRLQATGYYDKGPGRAAASASLWQRPNDRPQTESPGASSDVDDAPGAPFFHSAPHQDSICRPQEAGDGLSQLVFRLAQPGLPPREAKDTQPITSPSGQDRAAMAT